MGERDVDGDTRACDCHGEHLGAGGLLLWMGDSLRVGGWVVNSSAEGLVVVVRHVEASGSCALRRLMIAPLSVCVVETGTYYGVAVCAASPDSWTITMQGGCVQSVGIRVGFDIFVYRWRWWRSTAHLPSHVPARRITVQVLWILIDGGGTGRGCVQWLVLRRGAVSAAVQDVLRHVQGLAQARQGHGVRPHRQHVLRRHVVL